MRLRVEKPASLQIIKREAIKHLSHHAAIGTTRKVSQTRAQHRARINSTTRQVTHAFRLFFVSADSQESFADGSHPLRVEWFCLLQLRRFTVRRGAKRKRALPTRADSQI